MKRELGARILARRDDAPLQGFLSETITPLLAAHGIVADVVAVLPGDAGGLAGLVDGILAGGGVTVVLAVGGGPPAFERALFGSLRARVSRPIPGVAEFVRRAGATDPLACLFDPPAGMSAAGAMLLGLPRDPTWLTECVKTLAPVIRHAVEKAAGDPRDCGR